MIKIQSIKLNGINEFYNNIFYISNNGSDIEGTGAIDKAFLSYDRAFNSAKDGDLIYFKKGYYNITNLNTYGSFLYDKGKKLTIYAEPYTKAIINNPVNSNRDTHAIDITNASTKIIGFTIDYNVTNKDTNYSRSIFGGGGVTNGQIYNCHFIIKSVTSFSYANSSNYSSCNYCQFEILKGLEAPYTGSVKFEKCILNISTLGGGAIGNDNLFNSNYSSKYWSDLDSNNYGIFSGTYKWMVAKFLINDNSQLKVIGDSNSLNYIGDYPIKLDYFINHEWSDLGIITSDVINKIQNSKYKIIMYKK